MIYLLGGLSIAALLFVGGWAAGRITWHDRRRDVADVQATLDRTRRAREARDLADAPTLPNAGRFPVEAAELPITMSEVLAWGGRSQRAIEAGWAELERQQRGGSR